MHCLGRSVGFRIASSDCIGVVFPAQKPARRLKQLETRRCGSTGSMDQQIALIQEAFGRARGARLGGAPLDISVSRQFGEASLSLIHI